MTLRGTVLVAAAAAAFAALATRAEAAGDPARGQGLYGVCSTCHGERGEGLEEMNAPALAGREAWYLARQLNNFKSGIRGAHPDDVYGRQMAPMAQILTDAQAIEDVVAYLSSLKQ
jgi:cytochrome c oxidase subunit 2